MDRAYIFIKKKQNKFLLPIEKTILYNDGYNDIYIRCNLSTIFFININNDYKRYQEFLQKLINKKIYFRFNLGFHTFIYIEYINSLLINYVPSQYTININELLEKIKTDITGKYYYDCLNILSTNLKKHNDSYLNNLYRIYEYPKNKYYWINYNFYCKQFLKLTLQYNYELARSHINSDIACYHLSQNDSIYLYKSKLKIYALYNRLNYNSIFDILYMLLLYPQLLSVFPQSKLYKCIKKYIINNYKGTDILKDYYFIISFYKKLATSKQKQILQSYIDKINANCLLNDIKKLQTKFSL